MERLHESICKILLNETDSLWLSRGTPREQMVQRGGNMNTQSGGYVPQQQNYGRLQPRKPMYKPPAMGQSFRQESNGTNPQFRGAVANPERVARTRRSPYSYDNLVSTGRGRVNGVQLRGLRGGRSNEPTEGPRQSSQPINRNTGNNFDPTQFAQFLNNWQHGNYNPEQHANFMNR